MGAEVSYKAIYPCAEDGKVLDLDCENLTIRNLIEECDRHSRAMQKQADLLDG